MILGSHEFWQKAVKWYIIWRVIGWLTPIWALPVLFLSINHPHWIAFEILGSFALCGFLILVMGVIWLIDRIRFGF